MKHTPTPDEIKKQLRKILASADFKNSARLAAFLNYVVTKTLEDENCDLKGYIIGVDVFGKPADFNPESDATVRVEATRLRKALVLYYHGEGQHDPILINISKGAYKPRFMYQIPISNTPPLQDSKDEAQTGIKNPDYLSTSSSPKQNLLKKLYPAEHIKILIAAIGIILLSTIAFWAFTNRSVDDIRAEQTRKTILPSVAILPLYTIGSDAATKLGQDLTLAFLKKLSLFKSLNAVSADNVTNQRFWERHINDVAKEIGADYVVVGTLQIKDDAVNLSIKMLDSASGTYGWGHDKSYDIRSSGAEKFIDNVSSSIIGQLASPYGIIDTIERTRPPENTDQISENYRCVIDYHAYSNKKNPDDHEKVRACLEDTVADDPGYSDAWAALSWMYRDEYNMNYNVRGDVDDIKLRSFNAAQKAVEADTSNPRAHQYMALASQFKGMNELVKHHTEISLSLNPYDSEVVADAAWSMCQLGEWDRCKKLSDDAMALNPLHPNWYHMAPLLYHYRMGDYEQALIHALKYHQPDFLWSKLLLAACYAGVNRDKDAGVIAKEINEKFPEFQNNPYPVLNSWFIEDELVEKIAIGAEAAGVKINRDKIPSSTQTTSQ